MFREIDWVMIGTIIVMIAFMLGLLLGGMIAERGIRQWGEIKKEEKGDDYRFDNRTFHRRFHRDDDHGSGGIIEELGQA